MPQKIVMIVDDDPTVTTFLEFVVKRGGYVALKANSAEGALSLIAQLIPDLFILDVMMPGIDGIELCRQIRARARTASIPIVMFSADTSEQNVSSCLAAGANEFLAKPVSSANLLRRLDGYFANSTARTETTTF